MAIFYGHITPILAAQEHDMFIFSSNASQPAATAVTASVQLSDGTVAGTGYGPSISVAALNACINALESGNERFETAGRGHLKILP